MPVFLAFWSGFTSLSLEIVWSKLVGFRLFSLPQAFSIVLLSYLLGIAAGSWIGRRCCSGNSDLMLVSAKFLVMAGVIDILTPFFYPISVELWPVLPTTMVLIFVGAMLKGVVFPIAHHLGSMNAEKTSLGRSISNVYFANVLGATFGPVFVGFFLLDFVGIQKAFVLLGGSLVLLGVYIFYRQKAYINSIGACAALLVLLFWGGYHRQSCCLL
ncbi:hypothetical protein [Jeongeupia sp. USM3]|uniref:hypothetical protein n=1 Tax=Jeongeupia sp. USM3 TaxID=1906741 RepID=UPI0011AB5D19|nr:hypothetical protein [Jeongeupia sp. USM3]